KEGHGQVDEGHILVYLPMEDPAQVLDCLRPLTDYRFTFYHPDCQDEERGHIRCRAPSVDGFKQDLYRSERVICNSGFELISECLYLGKSVLTKPLHGQMEQLSNAHALEVLGYATVIKQI